MGTTGRASAAAVWVMGWEQAGRQGRAGQGRAGRQGVWCWSLCVVGAAGGVLVLFGTLRLFGVER